MCYHPWVGLDISPQGEFKPCCKYTETVATNVTDYQNSTKIAILRQQFLDGQQPTECIRCWRDEAAGLPSKRILDNEYIFENTAPPLTDIKVLSMPFGNICNLACRICNSYASSKWAQESEKVKASFPDIKIWGHNKFYKDADFMSAIKDITNEVIHVEIPGGEPFFADSSIHIDFLTHLTNHHPEKISLHYITNGTKFPDYNIITLWRKFKKVDIQISIDGTHAQFEYNRWPANWIIVQTNIKAYLDYQKLCNNIQLSVSHSVSIFTIYHLPEFLDWCKSFGLPAPYLGLVNRPLHYSITILPDEAKEVITKKFSGIEKLTPIVNALWAQNNIEELDNFVKYVKILDTQRQQNFADVFPELYQLLGERCQTLYQLY